MTRASVKPLGPGRNSTTWECLDASVNPPAMAHSFGYGQIAAEVIFAGLADLS